MARRDIDSGRKDSLGRTVKIGRQSDPQPASTDRYTAGYAEDFSSPSEINYYDFHDACIAAISHVDDEDTVDAFTDMESLTESYVDAEEHLREVMQSGAAEKSALSKEVLELAEYERDNMFSIREDAIRERDLDNSEEVAEMRKTLYRSMRMSEELNKYVDNVSGVDIRVLQQVHTDLVRGLEEEQYYLIEELENRGSYDVLPGGYEYW